MFGDFLKEFNPHQLEEEAEEPFWPLATPPYSPLFRAIEYEQQEAICANIEYIDLTTDEDSDEEPEDSVNEDDIVLPRDQEEEVFEPAIEEAVQVNVFGAEVEDLPVPQPEGALVYNVTNSTIHLQAPNVVINATDVTLIVKAEQPAVGHVAVLDVMRNPDFLGEDFALMMREYVRRKWEGMD